MVGHLKSVRRYRHRGLRVIFLAALIVAQVALILTTATPQLVRGSSPPDIGGQWSPIMTWPVVAVHMALLPTGDVLAWDAWFDDGASARVWHPDSQAFTATPEAYSHIFCAGQMQLGDGRLLVVGGHNGSDYGIQSANLFNSETSTWAQAANMHTARWYPSAITLADGRGLVLGGEITPGVFADIPEVYDPVRDQWTQLTGAQLNVDEYPQVYDLPNGKVFMNAGPDGNSRILDIASQQWSLVGANPVPSGTSAMYRPGKVISTGGGTNGGDPVQNVTAVIDLNQPSPAWRTVGSLTFARTLHNLVLLPDGKALAIGGSTVQSLVSTTGVLDAEMWDPNGETWSTMAAMQDLRMYHSTALLLPDGRVLVAGGGRLYPANDYLTAQIYSPPYLFHGARPTIASVPGNAGFDTSITVQTPDAANIGTVSLVRLGSVTHTFNMDQRYINLGFTRGTGALTVQTPANADIAPPGYYMLFLVDTNGIPSVAKVVQLVSTTPGVSIQAPTNGASISGSVPLTADVSDDAGTANVQFLLDGAPIGPNLTHAPYTMTWDTTTAADGAHTLTAREVSLLGTTTQSGGVGVTVANSGAPTIATISPSSGAIAGGGVVTVTGTGFQTGATATFGGVNASAVAISANGTTMTLVVPPHAAGVVDLVITNPGGKSAMLAAAYMYGAVAAFPQRPPSASPGASGPPNGLPQARSTTAPTGGALPNPIPTTR